MKRKKTEFSESKSQNGGKDQVRLITAAVRFIMFVWGVISGWSFAGLIFSLSAELSGSAAELAVKAFNAVLFGLIFMTLTKPMATLVIFLGKKIKGYFVTTPLNKTVAAVAGVMIGIMAGALVGAILAPYLILYARLIVTFLVAALFSYIGYLSAEKWLQISAEGEQYVIEYSGYIISSGAFFEPKVVYLSQFINGKVYILDKTVNKLIALSSDAEGKKALDNYTKLTEYCNVRIISSSGDEKEEEAVIKAAERRCLKIIIGQEGEIVSDAVKVLSLSKL